MKHVAEPLPANRVRRDALRSFRALLALLALLALVFVTTPAAALDWPQEISTERATIVVYQPQPELLEGNVLQGRAAMALELKDREDPIFGAFWFVARIDTDRDAGLATIRDVKVDRVRWPDSTDAGEERFTTTVNDALDDAVFEISLERLSSSLDAAAVVRDSLEELKNDPPAIVFREELAVLLLFDGEPRFSEVEDTPFERALNTPFLVVRRNRTREHYLSDGHYWYRSSAPLGPWALIDGPPQDLAALLPAPEEDSAKLDAPPAIVAVSEPTELIVTDGEPDWKSLPGGQLLYVENTETPWLRELISGDMYLLLSGRWFRAKSAAGPWTFVRADQLPRSFEDIPPASEIGGLRTSVAGTQEAEDALLDAQIPQTAAIQRSEATLTVEYDGAPKFEPVPGTKVAYAVNTGAQVLQVDGRYYAVDNGVWFTAASPTGPWIVADAIPSEKIQTIPPSSPVYNTTYVHIYESTPEVVYVGYTPGYLWSFPYHGVPVYGTGWYYRPYWGRWYYPRPPTWGFHVGYNPWTGWNFGVSWSNGFFHFGVGWSGGYGGAYRPWGCCGGWYGGGYRRPVVINTGNINIGNTVNVGNRTNIGNRIERRGGNRFDSARSNVYDRQAVRNRKADGRLASGELARARPAIERGNNVFADRNGNVARQVGDGWQQRQGGRWQDVQRPTSRMLEQPITRPATRPVAQPARPQNRPASTWGSSRPSSLDFSSIDRASRARSRGAQREFSRPRHLQHRAGGGRLRRR